MNELKLMRQVKIESASKSKLEYGLAYHKKILETHLSKILNKIFKQSRQENMDPVLQNRNESIY